jgi:signal transduction histidine kinase
VIRTCSTLNIENNDFMRLLIAIAIVFFGVALVSGGLILVRGGGLLNLFAYLLASCAWLAMAARLIDVIRAVFVDRLTPDSRALAVLRDPHQIEWLSVASRNLVKLVTHELNEPAGGVRGLAKRDIPPPLLSV